MDLTWEYRHAVRLASICAKGSMNYPQRVGLASVPTMRASQREQETLNLTKLTYRWVSSNHKLRHTRSESKGKAAPWQLLPTKHLKR
mmetsp:Transcript_71228/g.117980  ORF Transcript_71228/g.117980 Transcript_71228/m.117980 type:complete len:87 (+) Transcript_71228:3-263(+)